MKPTTPAPDRFWDHVFIRDDGCYLWTRSLIKGYGRFRTGGRGSLVVSAHRWAYEQEHGPIPEGFHLHHTCGERACVNPDHLELLSASEHTHRHRGKAVERIKKLPRTHCRRGHEMTPENTYTWMDRKTDRMQRRCRTCEVLRYRARYHGEPIPPMKDEFLLAPAAYG